ncbi:hypothetical protein [Bordetella bronchialis]|uniref:Uncharacterized protein n=1 Tax=Bordetella bronchialis TaxID=463025 RepID=A0A193FZP9_9BORD|nr:hypothetical protein [Bordetella bronchialis]ANN73237.1 hypothetical protein BAU08_19490 [Bordetella bronchialis]
MPPELKPELPPPRSKLELLYREMLESCAQATERSEAVAARLELVAQACQGLPSALRQAASAASLQVSVQASRALLDSARTIAATDRELRKTAHAISNGFLRNAWLTASLCVGSALLGALLGALTILAFFPR